MENSIKYKGKKLAIFIVLGISAAIILGFSMPKSLYDSLTGGEFLTLLKNKLDKHNQDIPEERVYLQFDKTFYKPGETVWFSGYLRNATDMKPSVQSDIMHVELIDPKGTTIKSLQIICKNGKASGEFDIEETFPGGIYKVKAYTNWQKNDANPPIFEKEFQVQKVILPRLKMKLDFERKAFGPGDEVIAKLILNTNENKPLSDYSFKYSGKLEGVEFLKDKFQTDKDGVAFVKFQLPKNLKSSDGLLNIMIDYQGQTESVSRSIPIILNNLKMAFFPEGGDMVSGLKNTIAFKVLNEFDKPADVEGVIFNENGTKVADFTSFHQGMGGFEFIPEKGVDYYAQITKPEGITEKFPLPESLSGCYVLKSKKVTDSKIILDVKTTEAEELSLVAQIRGKIYFTKSFNTNIGSNAVEIDTKDFPAGVAQITLFDSKNIERAERLVFVNKNRQLNISIGTDKEKYLPREKVKMTISVTDERGIPMPGSFSLTVTNDQLLSFADDKSGNILSQLLLQQDINEKVEEPAFYFDKKEPKADQALDYLLMTSGWRRFTWEKILSEKSPVITYNAEKTEILGTVFDENSKPVANATIEIQSTKQKFSANKNGKFSISGIDLYNPIVLVISGKDYQSQYYTVYNYGSDLNYYIYSNKYYNYDWGNENIRKVKGAEGFNVPMIVDEVMVEDAGFEAIDDLQNIEVIKEDNNNLNEIVKNEKEDDGKIVLDQQEISADEDIKSGELAIVDDRIFVNKKDFQENNAITYHRARQFAVPNYSKQDKVDVRTDFRSTIFWNGNIEIDRKGKANIEFYNSDEVSSYRAIVEGIGDDGTIGRQEKTIFTQLPFAMNVKIPTETVFDDIVEIPLTLINNTDKTVNGILKILNPESFDALNKVDKDQELKANDTKVIYLKYKVLNKTGISKFRASFEAEGLSDAFEKDVTTKAKGFPMTISFSGQELEENFVVNLTNVIDGSISAKFTAYPSVVSDLTQGIESILQEPSGCFEQTSMSSYPNVMVLNYLKATDNSDIKLQARADDLLDKGYSRLTTFETPEKGYDWFGSAPGNEALTAYGLMQFNEMKLHSKKVDQKMIDRTANWLISRKDGNGGFKRTNTAADSYGQASPEITDAYIVYALSEAGYKDIIKEFEKTYKTAMESEDAYQLALVANAAFNLNDKVKGENAVKELLKLQNSDGSWNGKVQSITCSTGNSLLIETTSLSILAAMKAQKADNLAITKGVKYLVSQRSGYGAFGSTQGTILALKALTAYSIFSRKTEEGGTIQFFVDGDLRVEKSFEAGEKGPIEFADLQKYITEGKHKIKVKFVGMKKALPYSFVVSWTTTLPQSQKECSIALDTKLLSDKVKTGETVRMAITLKNKTSNGLPANVAIIGIPAGLSAQPWQLKEIQEKKLVDYYEVIGNNIILYYRQMKPSELKTINLDLKAEIPGEYDAPASCAYLYYTNEFKDWKNVEKITVLK